MEKTVNAHTDALVEDYLRRLDTAASTLPPDRRAELMSEIREHLQEGLRHNGATDEVAVRNLLDRLGSPEEIVAEAVDPSPFPTVPVSAPETNSSAVASLVLGALWLLGIGSVLALIFGYRARREIKSSQPHQTGAGLATAGIVLGWVGIVLLLVVAAGALGLGVHSSPPVPIR
jgi:hypothetical protein